MQHSEEQQQIKVGIVGTGFIADLHMEALQRIQGIQISGCCDIHKGRSDTFARRWDLPSSHTSITSFLEQERIDVAHVLVPPDFHYSVAREIMEGGVDVLLEKPMGLSGDECGKLMQISREKTVRLGVNHNFIFYPLFERLKKDLASHRIGEPEYIIAFYGGPLGQLDSGKFGNWMFQEPGNIILEQGPHPISQIRAILGEIQKVTGTAAGKMELGKNQFFYDRWQAIIECEGGSGFVHLSFGNRYSTQRTLHVYGQDGVISIDFLNNLYLVQQKSIFPDYLDPLANAMRYFPPVINGVRGLVNYAFSKIKLRDRTDSFFLTMKNSLQAFYDALQSGADLPCRGEDGLRVVESCEKWIEAAGGPKNPEPVEIISEQQRKGSEEILVTGATGFIGGCLIEQLVAQGKGVRVLVRNPQGLRPALRSPLVRVIKGDITDPEKIQKAVQGIKIVYHLAHSLGQDWEDFYRLNVEPARHLAKACLKEKVKYLAFASTIAVYYYGDIPKGGTIDENIAIDKKPELRNLYARSKIVIENMLKEMVKKDNLPLIIFRPGIVVGKGGILNHSGVGQWTRDNVCAYWGMGKNELPFVLAEDVASALLKAMELEGLEGKTFNLVGDVRLSAREYISYLRHYSKRNIKAFPYPINLCYLSDVFKYSVKFMTGQHKNALLSYRDLANRSIFAHFNCETEKSLLSWKPCQAPDEFAAKAIGWAFKDA